VSFSERKLSFLHRCFVIALDLQANKSTPYSHYLAIHYRCEAAVAGAARGTEKEVLLSCERAQWSSYLTQKHPSTV